MSASKLDAVYRSILITKFFTKGWGKPENLRRLFEFRKIVSNRDECFKLVERDYPVTITKEQNLTDCKLLEGYFITPLERYLPGIVPEIAQKAHFQVLFPLHWQEQTCKPMCLHLAGTGDHFFWRRRNLMVKPLLKEAGIGGIILENPFYGLRKPTDQVRSSLHNVSDIFVMGGCLILESLVLFHWCERNGLGPLGVTGLSMGGHMASLAATNWPKPLVLVPCLSWSTASAVFLQGVMSHSINWDLLEDQYLSDGVYRDKLSKMVTIVDEAFLAGKKFAQTYTQSVGKNTEKIIEAKGISPHKELDITYKETHKLAEEQNSENNVSKPIYSNNKNFDLSLLRSKLKALLDDRKISVELYEKLSSNDKFELTPQDIEHINNLNEEDQKNNLLNHRTESAQPKDNVSPGTQNLNESANNTETLNTNAQISETQTKNTQNLETQNSEVLLNSNTKTSETEHSEMANQTPIISNTETDKEFTNRNVSPILEAKVMTLATADAKKNRKWHVSDLTSELWNLPFFRPSGKKIDISKIHWRDREALQFMRGIMDECTHLSNFSVPYDTSLIIAVCAKHDAYVPRDDTGTLEEIWPGVEVRYVDAGHVSAYILHQSLFRSCIIETFERSKKKWKDGKHID